MIAQFILRLYNISLIEGASHVCGGKKLTAHSVLCRQSDCPYETNSELVQSKYKSSKELIQREENRC